MAMYESKLLSLSLECNLKKKPGGYDSRPCHVGSQMTTQFNIVFLAKPKLECKKALEITLEVAIVAETASKKPWRAARAFLSRGLSRTPRDRQGRGGTRQVR